MASVHLLCGPVAAGKTTLARRLERELGAVRFSIDEWMLRLYGAEMARELFHERLRACMDVIYDLTLRLCSLDVDVVLDCGFWRRQHRALARERLLSSGVPLELYYFEVPADVRWARIERRNGALPADTYAITREMFDGFELCFEPPAEDERFTTVRA